MSSNVPRGDNETREVTLPAALLDRIEARLPRSDFETADEYVGFVVREVLAHVEADSDTDYDAIDDSEVESRLESLGYLE